MGYVREGFPEHEGYIAGFVPRHGVQPGSKLFRELCYPNDNAEIEVSLISAACECGWRSSRWKPAKATQWRPYTLLECDKDDERALALWQNHLEETSRQGLAGRGSPPSMVQKSQPAPRPPKEPPSYSCSCGTPFWKGTLKLDRDAIETHLKTHQDLKPCLGKSSGCENMTNSLESSCPGYCTECNANPAWCEFNEGRLELVSQGPDGLRHTLDGRGVHTGDTLELKLADGTWLPGRYEWNFHGDSLPTFHVGLAGEPVTSERDEGAIHLQTWAILRWPRRT